MKINSYKWANPTTIKKFKKQLETLKPPYKIGFYFIRETLGKFDYNNISQLPQDLMVKYKWLQDDNSAILTPVFLGYEKDKNNAGVIIRVL